jgi:hypothetical protein
MREWRRARRDRESARVTDQGIEPGICGRKVAIAEVIDAIEQEKLYRRAVLTVCMVCGRRSRWVREHPSRSTWRR